MTEARPTFTLEEARREIARQECSRRGHDFEFLMSGASLDPLSMFCGRCGRRYSVQAVED